MIMTKLNAVKAVGAAEPGTTEVKATARRRQFSGSEKRRILAAADLCTAPGEIGALWRREGVYSSHLRGCLQTVASDSILGLPGAQKAEFTCSK